MNSVATVRVIQTDGHRTDERRVWIVADCGCAWWVAGDSPVGALALGSMVKRALDHVEKGIPCVVPSSVVLTEPPG